MNPAQFQGRPETASAAFGDDGIAPDLDRARQAALVAHGVVIKFKEMGLPEELDPELASLSTDLGDLWGAQHSLTAQLESFLKPPPNPPKDWRSAGDHLADLKSTIEHMAWHVNSIRRPLNRIANFAYRRALESDQAG